MSTTQMYDMFMKEREQMTGNSTVEECVLATATSGALKKKLDDMLKYATNLWVVIHHQDVLVRPLNDLNLAI